MFTLILFVISANPFISPASQEPLVFSTWDVFEADKCATIWLIKRFVDKNAEINFFPKGTPIQKGIAFDTPDALLRRFHNRTTFESLLNHYKLKDQKLEFIGQIIHDIEINIWDKKRLQETIKIQRDLDEIIIQSKTAQEIVAKSCDYFDQLYEKIGAVSD